ncbi:MAG: hypothetical protein JWO11_3741 [Nocardioides sp.]|nr:hypothetical protein [Nocardioides sp.]
MATVPSPRTWAVGELLTAAKLNTDLRDGLNFLLAPPFALLQKTGNLPSTTSGTWTIVPWDSEQSDVDGGHDNVTNNSRYTIKTAGWWQFYATVAFFSNTTGHRGIRFRKNGTGNPLPGEIVLDSTDSTGQGTPVSLSVAQLAVNDYVEVEVLQDSATTLGVSPNIDNAPVFFSCLWIRA